MNKSKKEWLESMADKYHTKAEKAYRNYQETGITRYEREYNQAEDLAEAIDAAAAANEEHEQLLNLKSEICWIVSQAERGTYDEDDVFRNLSSLARTFCGYRKED